jgi:MYXO-CTERM domain-containing protein
MTALRWLLVSLLGAAALVVLGPSPAFACSCAAQAPRQYAARADVVVTGTVLDRAEARSRPWGATPEKFVVEADTVYAGEVAERFELDGGEPGDTCGLEGVEVGRRYVFFLQQARGELRGSLCGGTGNVSERQVERVLEPVAGQPTRGGPTEASSPGTTLEYAVGGGLVLLLAGGVWWLRRRRTSWT